MGREIKRVPANFDWPLEKVWSGALGPDDDGCKPCPDCFIASEDRPCGYNAVGSALYAAATRQPEHFNFREYFCPPQFAREIPTAERLARMGLLSSLGYHEALPVLPISSEKLQPEHHFIMEKLAERVAGDRKWKRSYMMGSITDNRMFMYDLLTVLADALDSNMEDMFLCRTCKGDASVVVNEEANRIFKNFHSENPDPSIGRVPQDVPKGEWWQVWETVSEGSPVTPAFATADELIDYLVKYGDSACQKRPDENPPTREAATRFVKGSGWVPSMVVSNGRITMGIQSAENFEEREVDLYEGNRG